MKDFKLFCECKRLNWAGQIMTHRSGKTFECVAVKGYTFIDNKVHIVLDVRDDKGKEMVEAFRPTDLRMGSVFAKEKPRQANKKAEKTVFEAEAMPTAAMGG